MDVQLTHLIDEQDHSKASLLEILELIRMLKEAAALGATPKLLEGASLGMIFEEPSTRTRISFETAMTKLGGHALYLKPGDVHLGERESLADTARVLSRMVDAVMIRAEEHETVTGYAQHSSIPVINGLTDLCHPTQAICDVFTMLEHLPAGKRLEDLNIAYIGPDNSQMLRSLMLICTRLGMNFTAVAPAGHQAPRGLVEAAQRNCATSSGSVGVSDNPSEAVAKADFIHCDLWWWVGEEELIPPRRAAFLPKFQLDGALLSQAPDRCRVMHCLPANRGVEATDAVLDSPQSIIFDQAENRLHTESALLVWLMYPRLKKATQELEAAHRARIDAFLEI